MLPFKLLTTLWLLYFMFHESGFHTNRPLHDLTIRSWTTDDGLISNSTTGVIQTPDGYIWISSFNGVSRFDGQRFTLFSTRNSTAFKTNAVIGMHVDEAGILWLATQGSGVLKYSGDFAKIPNVPNSTRIVRSLGEEVWVGTNEKGLFRIIENDAEPLFQNEIQGTVNAITFDTEGNIWVGTDADGLFRINNEKIVDHLRIEDGLSTNSIYSLDWTDNKLFVGTANGLFILENGTLTEIPELSGMGVNYINADAENAAWFATESGLFRMDSGDGKIDSFSEENGLPGRQISSLWFDAEGSLWLTTDKGGVIQLQSSQITNISTEDGLTSDDVNIVYESEANKLIGLDNGDVFVLRGTKLEKMELSTPMKKLGVRDIIDDKKGRLWIASYNGLIRKDGDSEILFDDTNALPDKRIRRLLEGEDFLWIATRGGLFKFKEERVIDSFTKDTGMGSNYIMCLAQDKEGNLVVGTKDGGLNILSNDGTIEIFFPDESPEGWLIFNVKIDKNGHIWCATNTGLYIFSDNTFRRISSDSGLPTDTFFDILQDNEGNTWLTSHMGVFRIDNTNLLNYIIEETDVLNFDHFDESEGMRTRECTAATPSYFDSEGLLYIPTFGGVVVIDPHTLQSNEYTPPVVISEVISNYETLDYKESLVFDPGSNQFEIRFASLSYLAPEKVRFQYRMRGFEEEWITSSEASARYSNLPNGEYTFEVKGSNNTGLWNEDPAMIKVVVLPYFYQTIGFYLVAITLILVTLILFYYWRITAVEQRNKELRKLNAELDSFVYSTSHDLRAPLASIQGLINIALVEGSTEKKDHYMGLMSKSVSKLDTFIKDIINYSRNSRLEIARDKIEFNELIEEIFSVLDYLDADTVVQRAIKIEQEVTFYSDRRRLFIVLNNLISNAFHYQKQNGEIKQIEVDISVSASEAIIRIADNGIGIPKDSVSRIFHMFYRASNKSIGSGLGLYIVRETLNKLRGQISVSSEENVGTEFTIKIPNLL